MIEFVLAKIDSCSLHSKHIIRSYIWLIKNFHEYIFKISKVLFLYSHKKDDFCHSASGVS